MARDRPTSIRLGRHIELLLASGVLNARYIVSTGDKLHAQVTTNRVVLTFCEVDFVPSPILARI